MEPDVQDAGPPAPAAAKPARSARSGSPRYFVGLRPDRAAARQLAGIAQALAVRCRGRPLAACDLHITLAFIGELPSEAAGRLRTGFAADCADLAPRVHPLALEHIDRFGPTLLWAGPVAPVAWLAELADTVRARLDAAAIGYDCKPFRAHLTLLRNARNRDATIAATRAPAPRVAVAHWQMAIGWNAGNASAARRYQWQSL